MVTTDLGGWALYDGYHHTVEGTVLAAFGPDGPPDGFDLASAAAAYRDAIDAALRPMGVRLSGNDFLGEVDADPWQVDIAGVIAEIDMWSVIWPGV